MLDIYANISMYVYIKLFYITFCYTFIYTNIFCLAPFDSYYLRMKGKCWYTIFCQYFHQFRFITQARIEVQNQDSCLQFPGVKNQEQTDWTKTQNKNNKNKPKQKQINKSKPNQIQIKRLYLYEYIQISWNLRFPFWIENKGISRKKDKLQTNIKL